MANYAWTYLILANNHLLSLLSCPGTEKIESLSSSALDGDITISGVKRVFLWRNNGSPCPRFTSSAPPLPSDEAVTSPAGTHLIHFGEVEKSQ